MRIAIVGSRHIEGDIRPLILSRLPVGTSEIVSGGAEGVDRMAAALAADLRLPLQEFLPNYDEFGKAAPLKRNEQIVDYADEVLAFWDGDSHGTRHTILTAIKVGKPVHIIPIKQKA